MQRVLGEPVLVSRNVAHTTQVDPQAPRAPGTLASHYAPRTPAELVEPGQLAARLAQAAGDGQRLAVLGLQPPPPSPSPSPSPVWRQAPADPQGYGRCLYSLMRELDDAGCQLMLVEAPPRNDDWQAVWDRLLRAAHRD